MVKYRGFSKIAIVATVAVVAFVGIVSFLVIDGNNKAVHYDDYDFASIIAPDEHNGNIDDHVKGNADAPAVIVEYADFQCPGCASMNSRVNAAVESANGNLAIVYRNYILSYHQNGTAAASAAEAAGLQGYWKPYADLLFKNQSEWEYASASERTALFNQYFLEASNNQGDLAQFKTDLASKRVSQKISFDMGIGKRIDIGGTPAFYVDGQLIDWSNKNGGSVTINGQTISWDTTLSGSEFQDILIRIAEAKLN